MMLREFSPGYFLLFLFARRVFISAPVVLDTCLTTFDMFMGAARFGEQGKVRSVYYLFMASAGCFGVRAKKVM